MGGVWKPLERIDPTAYGNDPINWRASLGSPSPGVESQTPLRFASIVFSDGTSPMLQLSFISSVGASYSVQYRDSFTSGSWLNLTNIPASTVGQLIQVTDQAAGNSASRFYRIVTPQQP